MKRNDSLDIVFAIVLALIIAKWWFSETVTTHWIYTGSSYPAARETYSVDRTSATVNLLQQWQGGSFVYTNKDCVIFDAKNWSCAGAELWANEGKVREEILSSDPRLREVSWLRWWLARLIHWGRAPEDSGKQ
jgi:hypothetical protein